MKKIIFLLTVLGFMATVNAHNSQVSTIVLVQNEQRIWSLNLSNSFDGFRYQLIKNYPDKDIDNLTADEFQKLVLKYVQENLYINANDAIAVELQEGVIKLGHHIDLKFKITELPDDLNSLDIRLMGYDENSQHNAILKISTPTYTSGNYVLKKGNQFKLYLQKTNGQFLMVEEIELNILWFIYGLVLVSLLGLIAVSNMFKPEKMVFSTVR